MSRRRTRAQIAAEGIDGPEYRWCSFGEGHWAPKENFPRCRKQGRQRRCRDCHRLNMRRWRSERRDRDVQRERYQNDPEHAKKVRAIRRMGMAVSRGTVERQPCEKCAAPKAQMHHDDYDEPTAVRWLCSGCHGTEHYPEATETAEVRDRFDAICVKYAAKREY